MDEEDNRVCSDSLNKSDSKRNLIVNYLPQTLTDGEFTAMFMNIGHLKSSKIVRHKATGYSYGFGFVEYENESDAAKAIEMLNGFQLQNKKLKVAYARPRSDEIKHANLYVRGIPRNMKQEELEELFGQCGDIIQCRVLKDNSSDNNKGVAFILYDRKEQAEAAILKFDGETLSGGSETLSVKFADDNSKKVPPAFLQYPIPPFRGAGFGGGPLRPGNIQNRYRFNPISNSFIGSTPGSASGNGGYILFVYNIGAEVDERNLHHLFLSYGTVLKTNVIRDPNTNQSKGYGFVTMSNYEDAVWAIEALNGFNYGGRPLQVSFKTPK